MVKLTMYVGGEKITEKFAPNGVSLKELYRSTIRAFANKFDQVYEYGNGSRAYILSPDYVPGFDGICKVEMV